MSEKTARCPNCAESIQAKAILCPFCQSGISNEHFRPCPHCAEMVRKTASVCRFCQTDLDSKLKAVSLDTPVDTASMEKRMRRGDTLDKATMAFSQRSGETNKITSRYGGAVRQQVLDVIVRQALAGAPWREICAGPMLVNNITEQDIEEELKRRKKYFDN